MTDKSTASGRLRFFFSLLLLALVSACSQSEPPAEATVDADAIDLIIEGDYVVTMDGSGTVVQSGAVAIDEGLIVAIGSAAEINSEYTANGHLAGENRIVMPGLINGHSHAAMTLLRGVADDLDLMDWLQNYIFPRRSGVRGRRVCENWHGARVLGNDSRRNDDISSTCTTTRT